MYRHPLDYRAAHQRIGRPYYGHKLRALLDPTPRSIEVQRTAWGLVVVLVIAAISVAMVITL